MIIFLSTRLLSLAAESLTINESNFSKRDVKACASSDCLCLVKYARFYLERSLPVGVDFDNKCRGTKETDVGIMTLEKSIGELPAFGRALHLLKYITNPGYVVGGAWLRKCLDQLKHTQLF